VDLTVDHGGEALSERLAHSLSARSIHIGGDRFAAFRLVSSLGTIDIWDRAGTSLEDDLARRDLTMHSFALDVSSGQLIDPFEGLRDLAHRRLVATSRTSFSADPVRVMRLCRFLAQIAGSIADAETLLLAKQSVSRLDQVAVERVGVELERLLSLQDAHIGVDAMTCLGIYPGLFLSDQGYAHADPLLADRLVAGFQIADTVGANLSMPADRSLVRMGILIGYLPATKTDSLKLRIRSKTSIPTLISNRKIRKIVEILETPAIPIHQAEQRWFIYQHGEAWPTAISLLAALRGEPALASPAIDAIREVSNLAAELGEDILSPRFLLSGHDLQTVLGLQPGQRLGEILRAVQRGQIEGEITNRSDAIDLARRLAARPSRNG
jgi:tRNA nucleotidyltransferase/poly(A) polymerase